MVDISKVTKKTLVDFIQVNFRKKGGIKFTKTELNAKTREYLEGIVHKHNVEDKLIAYSESQKYVVIGKQNGIEYIYNITAINEEECRKLLEEDGVKITFLALKSNTHKCKYCGGLAIGKNKDELCEECKQMFGHHYYSEL